MRMGEIKAIVIASVAKQSRAALHCSGLPRRHEAGSCLLAITVQPQKKGQDRSRPSLEF